MTNSLFLERSLSNLTSSSGEFDKSCNISPAAFANFQTTSATCSAFGITPSIRSSVNPLEAGRVLSELEDSSRDTRPEERTIAPVSRERIRVACTPAFCDRRLRWAKLSSSEVCCIALVMSLSCVESVGLERNKTVPRETRGGRDFVADGTECKVQLV
jgi:hypothetical protein